MFLNIKERIVFSTRCQKKADTFSKILPEFIHPWLEHSVVDFKYKIFEFTPNLRNCLWSAAAPNAAPPLFNDPTI